MIQKKSITLNIPTLFFCNQKCIFCTDSDKSSLLFLKKDIDKTIYDLLYSGKGKYDKVIFTSGEPTLNENLFDYIKKAKELDYKNIGLITNGSTLINNNIREKILNSNLDEITISLHGTIPQLHDYLTGIPGQYEKTFRGLLLLLKENKGLKIQISFVLNKYNIKSLFQSIIIFDKIGINKIIINTMRPEGYGKVKMKDLSIKYFDLIKEFNNLNNDKKRKIIDLIGKNILYIMDIPVCILYNMGLPVNVYGKVEKRIIIAKTKEIHDDDNFNEKIYIDKCSLCKYYGNCEGIYKDYLNIYLNEEFTPIK